MLTLLLLLLLLAAVMELRSDNDDNDDVKVSMLAGTAAIVTSRITASRRR